MEPLLPREVEDALPADPKLQLQLALRLASRAFSARDASCAHELSRLRAQLAARDATAAALEERASRAEAAAARAREESRGLAGEVRRLRGEVAKAESVRRALLRSLGEGDGGGDWGGDGDIYRGYENGVGVGDENAGVFGVGVGGVFGAVERTRTVASTTENDACDDGYTTPAAAAPAFAAAAAKTATGFGVVGGSYDGAEAATTTATAATTIPAAWKKQNPATTTTTTATKMSGKDFFRQARARLAPARFDALMGIVRSLNGGRSSRAAALRAAAETLGGEGGGCADLVPVFEGLLSQRVPVD